MESPLQLSPIAHYRDGSAYKANSPVQAGMDQMRTGFIELVAGQNYEQALEGLADGDLIWVIFVFHQSTGWRPKVRPPRWAEKKIGLFATRSPHRPNPIGLSCVRIRSIDGRHIAVDASDLIDGTPIIDIKPYLAFADAFPEALPSWYEEGPRYTLQLSATFEAQLAMVTPADAAIRAACESNLHYPPLLDRRKRIRTLGAGQYEFAFRTWRIRFRELDDDVLILEALHSGYTTEALLNEADPHQDKALHRRLRETNG